MTDPKNSAFENGQDLSKRLQRREERIPEAHKSGSISEKNDTRVADFAASIQGWFWETDADHRFTYFSPSVYDITGVAPEWHYGKTREEIGNPNSVSAKDWENHLEVINRHLPFSNFVFQRRGPDGVKWMRTSGRPVFDDREEFAGYRGSAADITAEVEAENRAERLASAIDDLDEFFVLWGPDDRLVVCNEKFREINAKVAWTTEPGTYFDDHIRAALAAGLFPNAVGREEEWFKERKERHLNPGEAFEMERQDGRWIILTEQKFTDGSVTSVSSDITERKRIERAIEEKNQILETAFRTIPDGVQVLDKDLNLVAWNDQLFDVLDLDQQAILNSADAGKAFRYALAERGGFGPGEIEDPVAGRAAIARTTVPVQYERQLTTGKWMECRGNPIEGGGYVAVYQDITENKQIREHLEKLASTDALTEISNRRGFIEIAESEFHRTQRYKRPLSFLLLDIDHFKSVNDQYGHGVGDETLRQVVNVCRKVLRGSDNIGRFGGEEFVVMLPETNTDGAGLVAERMRQAVDETAMTAEIGELRVTISIGVAMAKAKHKSPDDVILDADAALYDAKRGGRNMVAYR